MTVQNAWNTIQKNSLWLVAIGLMVASTCFDGVYLEKLSVLVGFGFALNVCADIANPALMYWYGRLQQDKSTVKKRRSESVLVWERIAIAYSWLFSWRQLRERVYLTETAPLAAKLNGSPVAAVIEIELLALLYAGFVPLLLAGVGALQALIAGRIENEAAEPKQQRNASEQEQAASAYVCEICGVSYDRQQQLNGHMRAHKDKDRSNGHKQLQHAQVHKEQ